MSIAAGLENTAETYYGLIDKCELVGKEYHFLFDCSFAEDYERLSVAGAADAIVEI
jgi:hypothetical protein